MIELLAAQRIQNECGEDESCIERVKSEINEEFSRRTQTQVEEPSESSRSNQALKGIIQQKITEFAGENNLSLVTAMIFFLVLFPFSGLLAWVLSIFPYFFFLIFKRIGLIEKKEQTVSQQFFV